MTRVLFIGQTPETVDFSDPAIPSGFNAEKIHAGIAIGMGKMAERGWQADLCLIPPDKTAALVLENQLTSTNYDCVVIGGGIRLPPKACHCSRLSPTLYIRLRLTLSLHSTHGRRTPPKPPRAGYEPIDRRATDLAVEVIAFSTSRNFRFPEAVARHRQKWVAMQSFP